ncbi:hypothetical protein KPL74_11060 [Bacillus sp. NP157]|nr:hypothetical protein KPL74_11060 [Bacillus sp. NP157]
MLLRHATFQDLQAIALSRRFSLTGQEEKWAFTDLVTGGRDEGDGRYSLLRHMGQQSMPAVAQDRAAWCHAQGKTVGESADLMGVAYGRVVAHFKAAGLPVRHAKGGAEAWRRQNALKQGGLSVSERRALRRQQVDELYRQGLTGSEIAKRMGIPVGMVINDRGALRPAPKSEEVQRNEVAELLRQRASAPDVAARLGLSQRHVRDAAKFLGLPIFHASFERRQQLARLIDAGCTSLGRLAEQLGRTPEEVKRDAKALGVSLPGI